MNNLVLRPANFLEFVGQEKLTYTLKTMIEGSRHRKEPLDHILFYGPPGTGKTSLATILANELGAKIHYLQGALLEKKSDILTVFANVKENDIVFIDEIHSMNKNVEEIIYNAMEDYKIDIIIGPEGNSKVMRMNLKPFTLIGATTKINLLTQPLKDRFGFIARLSQYNEEDLEKILQNSENVLNIKSENGVIPLVAKYSKGTPRVANHLLKRILDFSIQNKEDRISKKTAYSTFKHLELYDLGLGREHIEYLRVLNETFENKFAAIDSIAGVLNISKEILIYELEPLLLYLKLVTKGPRGRKITTKGVDYLLKNKLEII
ncbi:Holliday junction branch migration DNA helicase RuvB [Mycoplasmopsis caviae]|uniref:Holliday junction branch migration complex subunit RuvB n=1 Tax=Mycoplasmopsis caviae TaxID=55603 RepID=A0A3P8KA19_9BACT|nr:Holliday junction branch migration DNA helicase RuvB [Mycoplasmopsis caviae]UUD34953.1 Holliday junction branch migration DNA helicase RuvB [Mycoplasmopsis caviae]VDR42219.1 holliday junction ATP-dependent DNA helicase ruvb [Mycoplasmopsis caviae]